MSRIKCVSLVAKAQTPPLIPAGTMAATAFTRPSCELGVEVAGRGWPQGKIVRKPSDPACGTTVTLSEYACAVAGMLQELVGMSNSRATAPPLRSGPPNGPFGFRVSASRHGLAGIN